jgi:O-antigen biosynthesis protein
MTVVCIVGMHRSGTSMVARMLNLCGVELGNEKDLRPAAGDNPDGFWENINFIGINEKILSKLGASWDYPPILESGWETSSMFDECRQEAVSLINFMSSHPFWGWKDPRTSLTLPFWMELIPDLKMIICLRNPTEVAHSLAHRNNFSYKFSMDLWRDYNQALFSGITPENQLISHYESYFLEPQDELRRLVDFIGITSDDHSIKKACDSAMPSLRHNFSTIEGLITSVASPDVSRLYAEMCMQAGHVYWNPTQNKLQKLISTDGDDKYSLEDNLFLGLIKNNPTFHKLAEHLSKKEQKIQTLIAHIHEKDIQISAQSVEIRRFKALVAAPNQVLTLLSSIWTGFQIFVPPKSPQEQLARKFTKKLLKIYKYFKEERKYLSWINKYDPVLFQRNTQAASIRQKILISVLMPVYAPPLAFLDEAIKSVRSQLYPHWELCIVDDASPDPAIRALIERHASEDPRIRHAFREINGHISAASNSALKLATGDFIALLDHDDVLHPLALYYVAEEIDKHPDVEVIYSDEDKLSEEGRRVDPYFKPDFDYNLLLSQNMISHLGVYRTDTVRNAGGFRLGFEGSQDYDLALRVIEKIEPRQVRHIPHVLYHWRILEQSAASGMESKPYAYGAAMRALREHLARKNVDSTVEFALERHSYRVGYKLSEPVPSVEIVIHSQEPSKCLLHVINSILLNTQYPSYKISICMNYEMQDPGMLELWQKDRRVSIHQNTPDASPAQCYNQVVSASSGDYICIVDEKLDGFSAVWLVELLGGASQIGVGAIGPLLLNPDGSIFSSGLILMPNTLPEKLYSGASNDGRDLYGWHVIQRSFSAISGELLLFKRSHFEGVEGLDETISTGGLALLDLCLKFRRQGLQNVINPDIELLFQENSAPKGKNPSRDHSVIFTKDWHKLEERWRTWFEKDPAFSPNLDLKKGKIILARPPRVKDSWAEF